MIMSVTQSIKCSVIIMNHQPYAQCSINEQKYNKILLNEMSSTFKCNVECKSVPSIIIKKKIKF
jgi:hypothetical protein